jgi:hypothetical protein
MEQSEAKFWIIQEGLLQLLFTDFIQGFHFTLQDETGTLQRFAEIELARVGGSGVVKIRFSPEFNKSCCIPPEFISTFCRCGTRPHYSGFAIFGKVL